MSAALRFLPITSLILSSTVAQAERRKHFDQAAIGELAASIKTVGMLAPIVARPLTAEAPDRFEIVAGERRFVAAQKAGLEEVPVNVRSLSDEEVLEVQLVENLQREDLHELAEAEGYEQLLKLGHSVEEMAGKVGKSQRTIYTRMQLLKLGPAERDAFYRGDLTASTALLLSRIADAASRREACGKITKPQYGDGPMSYRQAADFIEREYMLRLNDAPFSTKDAQLLPKAGACTSCPKRTGNQPADLFGDIKSPADVCTDRVCFKLKREAHTAQLLKKAKEDGQRIISGADAKKVISFESEHNDHVSLGGGYVQLGDKPWADKKNRSYRQLLGKDVPTIVIKTPKGRVIEVLDKATAEKALKDAGISSVRMGSSPTRSSTGSGKATNSGGDKKVKIERLFRKKLVHAIFERAPAKPARAAIEGILQLELEAIGFEDLFEAIGWKSPGYSGLGKFLAKLGDAELWRLVAVVRFAEECGNYGSDKEMVAAATKMKIDYAALRKAAALEVDPPKAAPAKASKKAARKRK